MKPIGSMRIKTNASDEKRIGPNKRSDQINTVAVQLEELFERIAPLPITYDIAPLHPPYFSEFTYYDVLGGLYLATLNEEINARVMTQAINSVTEIDYSHITSLKNTVKDKYVLNSAQLSYPDAKKIVFYPGSNLLHVVDHSLLDKILFADDSIVIKPHPITTDEGLKIMAKRYGYYRIIPPRESGMAYLKQCTQLYTPANSEIGIIAAALKLPMVNISNMQYYPKLTYASLYREFKDNDTEHNYEILAKILTAKNSGILMPWVLDAELRIREFCKLAMTNRQVFKSSWPWLGDNTPINKK